MYADYSYYINDFFGNVIGADDFPRLSSRASDFIDYYTKGKAANATDAETAIKKACCAIAEQMFADEQAKAVAAKAVASALSATSGEVKSETVGSWSLSYATSADYSAKSTTPKDERKTYADIALQYLANTGLLYRGGCCQCNCLTT